MAAVKNYVLFPEKFPFSKQKLLNIISYHIISNNIILLIYGHLKIDVCNLELVLDFRNNIGCKNYYFMALEYNPNNMFENRNRRFIGFQYCDFMECVYHGITNAYSLIHTLHV